MEIEDDSVWLNWLKDTLAARPARPNRYIDSERGVENHKRHSEERKAYAELKRGLDKLRALNAR